MAADRLAVSDLVKGVRLNESLLQDLDYFYETRRDQVSRHTLINTPPPWVSLSVTLHTVYVTVCVDTVI